MPETNIVVSFVSDLIDRAKGLMQQNRASLNVKQAEKTTQQKADEAAQGSQKEGRPKRQLRTILRPTAIGGGFPVAMGFFSYDTPFAVDIGGTPGQRVPFTITSGNGEQTLSSHIEHYGDPGFEGPTLTFHSDPALDLYYRQNYGIDSEDVNYRLFYKDPPVASWYYETVYKYPVGDADGGGIEWIGLPVDGKTFVIVVFRRSFVTSDRAQVVQTNTYTFNVESLGDDLWRVGPITTGTADPVPEVSEETTQFPTGKFLDAAAFLVSYESVKSIPLPSGLRSVMENGIPSEIGGYYVDYPGFTASSYGMNEDWLEVSMADGFELATGFNNDYYTGGIYPVLQRDPDEWRDVMGDPSVEDPYTLEGAADFLSTSFNPRAYLFSCINVGTCEPGKIGHDKASSPTATTFTPNRPEGTTLTTWRPDGSTALHVWDGGLAGYCRSKLIELGFTEEDLTP
jgi:hypothetical protein